MARQQVSTRRLAFGVGAKRALEHALTLVVLFALGLCALAMCSVPVATVHDVFATTVRTHVEGPGETHARLERPSPWPAYATRSIVFVGLGLLVLWGARGFARRATARARTRDAREFIGEIVIGDDGLRITRYVTQELVSYSQLEEVSVTPRALVLRLTGDRRVTLPAAQPEELRAEIEIARARYVPREGPPLSGDAEALSTELLATSYRKPTLSLDELTALACAMGAAPAARIAAARALARGAPPRSLALVRDSLERMANEDLARAIEAALLTEPDPAIRP